MEGYLRRDVCLGLDDSLHKLALLNASSIIQIDSQPELDLQFEMCSARIAYSHAIAHLIVNSQHSNEIRYYEVLTDNSFTFHRLMTGPVSNRVPVTGLGAGGTDIRILPTGQIEIYNTSTDKSGVDVYNPAGDLLRHLNVPYSSGGINYIDSLGSPIMSNDPILFGIIDGIQCWNMYPLGGFRAAQIDVPGDGGILFKPDGSKVWFQFSYQIPNRIAVKGNVAWVTFAGFNTPEPDAVPFVPYGSNPVPGYDPKADLIKIRDELNVVISKL